MCCIELRFNSIFIFRFSFSVFLEIPFAVCFVQCSWFERFANLHQKEYLSLIVIYFCIMVGGWDRAGRVGLQFAATSKLVRPGNHYYLLHNLFLYPPYNYKFYSK